MSWFKAWKQKLLFEPSVLGLVFNPFYFARKNLLDGLLDFFPRLEGRVLDVGCGRKPYRHLVPALDYVGLELDTSELRKLGAADLYYSGEAFPVLDASFDAVICSQVLEHVFTPTLFLTEIKRVLRPGGLLLLTVPFAWDEHSQPFDYGRYSSFGLNHLLTEAGFEVVAQRKTCADGRALVQLASAYVYKVMHTRHRTLNLVSQLLIIAPVNLLGGFLAFMLPSNHDFYLDNIVLVRKPTDASGKPEGHPSSQPEHSA